jgi:hypothetical protein
MHMAVVDNIVCQVLLPHSLIVDHIDLKGVVVACVHSHVGVPPVEVDKGGGVGMVAVAEIEEGLDFGTAPVAPFYHLDLTFVVF